MTLLSLAESPQQFGLAYRLAADSSFGTDEMPPGAVVRGTIACAPANQRRSPGLLLQPPGLERIAAERDQPPRESARQNKELEHFQHRIAFPLRLKML